ncbi:iron hydrogenase small subunit, partial [Candidatus Woesearchaeota archaeon]|nr:iron hydrogenase small subunit [Candidatus Woesearchaeota archaeon]
KATRKSHHNKQVLKLYKEFLGAVGGAKAHRILHTKYTPRDVIKASDYQ